MKKYFLLISLFLGLCLLTSCEIEDTVFNPNPDENITDSFAGFDLDYDYENQTTPNYIRKDNTRNNEIRNEAAALGRVLFYDKNLSVDNSISCSSCHQQATAFSDNSIASLGVNGSTGRHSMRLVNARFARETNFFWDERASTLEEQTTMPIKDHAEMGFSGVNGDPSIDDLMAKMNGIDYYEVLFSSAFGTSEITESRMQDALAQFIRSIQSFDSKYDQGLAQANNPNGNFPNFTESENLGKSLFTQGIQFQGNSGNRIGGGLACNRCHQGPEFDITPNSGNNGVIGTLQNNGEIDMTVTRSPTLRDLFNQAGQLNGPMMHTGGFNTVDMMINHYNSITANGNPGLDNRLRRGGGVQLNITPTERLALVDFLKTLSGENIYEDAKWSDPFDK